MWTETAREQYRREDLRYASDMTDAEWALIPGQKALGRPRIVPLRGVVDALLYIFADRVSVASAAARFSEAVDRAALLLRLAGRRAVGKGQLLVGPIICIPIHDAEGNLVAYAGRWASDTIPNGMPRYLLSTAFRKRDVLFNLHRIRRGDRIVLVEGYWSVFRLHSLGIPVAALMGSTISLQQIAFLAERNTRFVTLLMDGDRAGRNGRKITPLLAQKLFAPLLPNGEKPDSMSGSYLAALKNHLSS